MYGVANLSVISMRAEPSHRAELVSQLLFGDAYHVLEQNPDWLQIETCDCNYVGWIDRRLHNPLSTEELQAYLAAPKYVVRDILFFVESMGVHARFPIFIGSSLPLPQNGIVTLGNSSFKVDFPKDNFTEEPSDLRACLLQFATTYLQSPYLWGGRTPAGIDCSGFAQIVYKSIGISLPRDASQQVACGTTVDFVEETEVGDLAFFENENGNITHVGMVCAPGQILHASAKVRIDLLDTTGIFSQEEGRYTHRLRIIKRLIN